MRRRSTAVKFSIAAREVEWLYGRLGAEWRHLIHKYPHDPEMLLKVPLLVRFEYVAGLTRRGVRDRMREKYPDVRLPEDLGGELDKPLQGFLVAARRSVIFICADLPHLTQRFVAAHEGGHLVREYCLRREPLPLSLRKPANDGGVHLAAREVFVHAVENVHIAARERRGARANGPMSPDEQRERYANLFAAELLAPMEKVFHLRDQGLWGRDLVDTVQDMFAVSRSFASYRVEELLFATDDRSVDQRDTEVA